MQFYSNYRPVKRPDSFNNERNGETLGLLLVLGTRQFIHEVFEKQTIFHKAQRQNTTFCPVILSLQSSACYSTPRGKEEERTKSYERNAFTDLVQTV